MLCWILQAQEGIQRINSREITKFHQHKTPYIHTIALFEIRLHQDNYKKKGFLLCNWGEIFRLCVYGKKQPFTESNISSCSNVSMFNKDENCMLMWPNLTLKYVTNTPPNGIRWN